MPSLILRTAIGSISVKTQDLMQPPAAPSGLIASVISESQIDLTWTDNSDNETDFIIERSFNGLTGWSAIDMTAADVNETSNTGLSSDTTYYYRVRSINVVGSSDYS